MKSLKVSILLLSFVFSQDCFADDTNHGGTNLEQKSSSASDCCTDLYFGSTGILAGSEQDLIIGNYKRISDGPNGRWYYQQIENSDIKVYYMPDFEVIIPCYCQKFSS